MTRFVSAANQTESEKPSIGIVVMVSMDFSSGELNVHDGVGTIVDTFSSPTRSYLGVGKLGSISGSVNDSIEVIAKPIKLALTGVDSGVLSSAMTEDYQGRDVLVSLGFMENGALIAAPEVVWEGRMDFIEIDLGQGTGSVTVNCESRLRKEPRIARYTDQDQQVAHSGDTFYENLHLIPGFKSQWGDQPTGYAVSPFSYGGPRNYERSL